MSRRLEVELTSRRDDGSWTWRAAGAKQPKGVLDGDLLPPGAGEGDVLRVDADFEVDGIFVIQVLPPKARSGKPPAERIELIGPRIGLRVPPPPAWEVVAAASATATGPSVARASEVSVPAAASAATSPATAMRGQVRMGMGRSGVANVTETAASVPAAMPSEPSQATQRGRRPPHPIDRRGPRLASSGLAASTATRSSPRCLPSSRWWLNRSPAADSLP